MTTQTRRRVRRPKLADTNILRRKDFTEDLWTIWLEKPEGFTFKPGQYCTIGSEGVERAYSIVSAPYEEDLELFIELVPPPDGNLTPLLFDLKEGDSVTIRPRAKGIFVFDPSQPNQLFVATVTGVVPYISIIRQYIEDGTDRAPLLRSDGRELPRRIRVRHRTGTACRRTSRPGHFRPNDQPPGRGAERGLDGRNRPRQQHRRTVCREMGTGPTGHHRLRLRSPRHDRGRERPHGSQGLRCQRRTLLEGRRLDGNPKSRHMKADSHESAFLLAQANVLFSC